MRLLKWILLLIGLTMIGNTNFAQTNYEIHTTTITEKFDSKGNPSAIKIWSNGVQGDKEVNVEIVVSPANELLKLKINDEQIMPLMFKEYRILTDYILNYVYEESKEPEPKTVTQNTKIVSDDPANETKLSESDKTALMNIITKELMKDQLIEPSEVFEFLITGNVLYLNGNKQTETVFNKYKALYDQHSNVILSKTTYFQITQTL